ncbi:hypothetical protein ACFVT2_27555 [Streptomyces sp. NPDC058000]|uniref:hypothetical protein n=1 Tax=Streptomyces sp. NPDC058000 TaxID=3346299 RepID=UPI0036E5DE97
MIDEAADDGREFRPLAGLSAGERWQIIALPPSIAELTAVKHFALHGSNPVRIPPEFGEDYAQLPHTGRHPGIIGSTD